MEDPSSGNIEPSNLFAREDCAELWMKLRFIINSRFQRLSQRVNLDGVLIDVMIEVSEGLSKRKWPEDVGPEAYLIQYVRNRVGYKLKRESRLLSLEDDPDQLFAAKSPYAPRPGLSHRQIESEQFCQKVLELVGDDDLVRELAKLWMREGPKMKPSKAAVELGVPLREVRNGQKRLRRRILKLLEEEQGDD